MKYNRELMSYNSHNKLVKKKSKKRLHEDMETTANGKKYREKAREKHRSVLARNSLQSASSRKSDGRGSSREVRSNNEIAVKMHGPISRKRMKILQARIELGKHPTVSTKNKRSRSHTTRNETNTLVSAPEVIEIDSSSNSVPDEEHKEEEEMSINVADNENSGNISDHDEEISDTSADTAPQFFNSTNSRQVLLLLKRKIYFHGALKIRLLAGDVCIFGYAMQDNETVTANSPRGHSFLYISPSTQHQNQQSETNEHLEKLKSNLKKLSNIFLREDMKEIISNFDSSNDAVVLLENDFSKSIFMIENYMKESVFPNVNKFTCRPFHQSESILRSQFLPYTTTGLKINSQWQNIIMTECSRHVIIGGKGVGKSTFLRYFINKNLREFKKILLIDLDIGQPEMFLPQTVSATIITEPILGPGYLRNKSPQKSYLFGDVNVLVSSIKYLKCVLKLLNYCLSNEEFNSIPWVVNTMGYNRGFGLELIAAVLQVLKPTDLIQIQASHTANNFQRMLTADEVNNFRFHFFEEEVRNIDHNCTYSTHICDTMSQSSQRRFWDISPKDLRFAIVLSKLGNILRGNAKWITDVKPVCASLDDLKIVVVNDDGINPDLNRNVINGSLVYLCQAKDGETDDILECYGLGIVRAVELGNNKVYLLPSIPSVDLQYVNTLAICSIPLPTTILINQSSKISGSVPYVYSSDNFIGSKQIVPITYRPDKLSKNNTKN